MEPSRTFMRFVTKKTPATSPIEGDKIVIPASKLPPEPLGGQAIYLIVNKKGQIAVVDDAPFTEDCTIVRVVDGEFQRLVGTRNSFAGDEDWGKEDTLYSITEDYVIQGLWKPVEICDHFDTRDFLDEE